MANKQMDNGVSSENPSECLYDIHISHDDTDNVDRRFHGVDKRFHGVDERFNDVDDETIPLKRFEEEKFEPPDGGWGWVVAIGCCTITTLTSMIGPCFGVLFSRFLISLDTSSTTTAWIFNSFLCLWNGCGLFIRPLIEVFGWRPIAITGGIMNTLAFIITAFSPSAEFLFLSFSILSGIGGGSMGYICFTILPHFFNKRKGLANGLMMAGVCMGQFIGPPIIGFLQDEYGFKGATIITGAVMLNACAAAMVFHPSEWHLKRVTVKVTQLPLVNKRIRTLSFQAQTGLVKSQSGVCLGDSLGALEVEISQMILGSNNLDEDPGPVGKRGTEGVLNSTNQNVLRTLTTSIKSEEEEDKEEIRSIIHATVSSKTEYDKEKTNCLKIFLIALKKVMQSITSDLLALRSPVVFILAGGAICTLNGYLNFLMTVPFALQAAGHSLEMSAWCISISAISNLIARLFSSLLSDWSRFNVKFCYISGTLIIALTMFSFPLVMDSEPMIMVVMGFWGCGVGLNMGVYNLVILSVVGLEKLGAVFGTCSFMVAVGFVVTGPIIGYIRDTSGSYAVSIWVLSGMVSFGLILWMLMPIAISHDKKKNTTRKANTNLE